MPAATGAVAPAPARYPGGGDGPMRAPVRTVNRAGLTVDGEVA
ncbi:hypothetical protein [Micromonospora sp. R77]|nr:hypothetical protein [Micromonospora sp. R77]